MANAGHSCRIYPDFAYISGNGRPTAAIWNISGLDQIQAALGELNAPVGGQAHASSTQFRAGGHDMYEKAGT